MVNFLNGINIGVPGAYAFLTSTQSRPVDVQPFRTAYVVGHSSLTTAPKNIPTRVTSVADFTNVFGTSESLNNIKLFFANSQGYGNLYFVKVAIPIQYSLVISGTTAGTYPLTINGIIKNIVVSSGATTAAIAADIRDILTTDPILQKELTATEGATPSTVTIKSSKPAADLLITEDNEIMTIAITTTATPTASDYVYTLQNVFDPSLEAGFITAPEVFKSMNASSRLSVQVAMENLASGARYQWQALIDPGSVTEIINVDRAIAEAVTYTSPQGHSAYYYPYVIDLDDHVIPPSTGVAGVALLRYVIDGFAEPPAGTLYALKGVKGLAYNTVYAEQNVANPKGVNIILNKPGYGIVIWGARTLSSDPNIRFMSTRIILNIIINSLYKGFDNEIFTSIGGSGSVLSAIQRKAESLMTTFFQSGLLYGASPTEAYEVIADATVQIPSLLQQGLVNMFLWVVPATILERLVINIKQVAIGELQIVVASDLGAIQETASTGDAVTAEAPAE